MIQVNRIYLIFNRLVTKKFLVDTSDNYTEKFPFQVHILYPLYPVHLSFLFILVLIAPCRTPLSV